MSEARRRETQHHPAEKLILAWQSAARALVVRELLLQEAHRLAIEATPKFDGAGRRETEEEALIRALIEREVASPTRKVVTATIRKTAHVSGLPRFTRWRTS